MCDKVVSKDTFILKYCHGKYNTQEMFDKSVKPCLQTLIFVHDCFVRSKIIEELDSSLFHDDYVVFGDLWFNLVTLSREYIGLNSITLDNINLGDDHFDNCDPEPINYIKL